MLEGRGRQGGHHRSCPCGVSGRRRRQALGGADGKLLASPQCRLLLRLLGTTAPLIQLMPCAL
jgi:hypothetical protein